MPSTGATTISTSHGRLGDSGAPSRPPIVRLISVSRGIAPSPTIQPVRIWRQANDLADTENNLHAETRRIVEEIYGPASQALPGLDVGRSYRSPSKYFPYGGDVVDVFQYANGYTSIAVVDIVGHGTLAATNAGLVKHALRAFASSGLAARSAVQALNRLCIECSVFDAANFLHRCYLPLSRPTGARSSM